MPILLLVPRGGVKWLIEKPRTPMEYHNYLVDKLGGKDVDSRPKTLLLSLLWCRIASLASLDDENKSSAELRLNSVFDDTEALSTWLTARLETTMGPATHHQAQTQQIYFQAPPSVPPPSGFSQNVGGDAAAGGTVSNLTKPKLSEMGLAALKGFCKTMSLNGIPLLWSNWQTTSCPKELRRYFDEAYITAIEELGIDKSETCVYFLEDSTLKDWKGLDFAPGGGNLIWDWLMKGLSILLLMTWATADKLEAEAEQALYDETEGTRTEGQARRRAKKDVRTPPAEWAKLKALVNTYCITLWAVCDRSCPHFEGSWLVRQAITGKVGDDEKYFNKNGGYLSRK